MGRVSAAVLFGFRMKQVSAMDCFKKLKIFAEERQWQVRNFPLLMHELASVLQKGLECHKRSPCPVLRYSRYHGNLLFPESILSPDQLTCLPRYIKSTWHASMRNVGILMVTRKQYQHAGGPRRREELRRLLWWRLWPPIDWDGPPSSHTWVLRTWRRQLMYAWGPIAKNWTSVRTSCLMCRAMPHLVRAIWSPYQLWPVQVVISDARISIHLCNAVLRSW